MMAHFPLNAQAYCQDKLSTRQIANFVAVSKTVLQTECFHACLRSNIDLLLTSSGNYVYQHRLIWPIMYLLAQFLYTVSLYVSYEYRAN